MKNDEVKALKSAAQTIYWACTLDEFFKKNFAEYKAFRMSDEASKIMSGVRYARNRVSHQFTQLLYITEGACIPTPVPTPLFEIRWKSIKQPPLPDGESKKESLAHCYAEVLAKKPVRVGFKSIQDFFKRFSEAFPTCA